MRIVVDEFDEKLFCVSIAATICFEFFYRKYAGSPISFDIFFVPAMLVVFGIIVSLKTNETYDYFLKDHSL